MSQKLLESVERFLRGETPVEVFVDQYIDHWRAERDSGEMLADDPVTSEKLSSIFCAVDMYAPEEDRLEYEYDEAQLRVEIRKLLEGNKRSHGSSDADF